jgi:hypothetical protein
MDLLLLLLLLKVPGTIYLITCDYINVGGGGGFGDE